jgi:hypothetical protein
MCHSSKSKKKKEGLFVCSCTTSQTLVWAFCNRESTDKGMLQWKGRKKCTIRAFLSSNQQYTTHAVHTPKFGVCMPYIHIFFHLGKNKIKAKTTYCSQKKIPNNIAYKKGKFTKIKLIIITKNNSIIYLFTYFLAFI